MNQKGDAANRHSLLSERVRLATTSGLGRGGWRQLAATCRARRLDCSGRGAPALSGRGQPTECALRRGRYYRGLARRSGRFSSRSLRLPRHSLLPAAVFLTASCFGVCMVARAPRDAHRLDNVAAVLLGNLLWQFWLPSPGEQRSSGNLAMMAFLLQLQNSGWSILLWLDGIPVFLATFGL